MPQVHLCIARFRQSADVPCLAAVALALHLILATGAPSYASPADLRVTAESVNLRAGPTEHDDIVGKANRGDILTAREGRNGEWIEVSAPDNISGWIYGELVTDGVVAVSRLRVRAGPGINYAPIARMDQGDKVTIRGKKGDWVQIAPPMQSSLWIHEQFVSDAGDSRKSKAVVGKKTESAGRSVKRETLSRGVASGSLEKPTEASVAPSLSKWRAARKARAAETGKPRETIPVAEVRDVAPLQATPATDSVQGPPPGATVDRYDAGRSVVYRGTLRPMGMTVWRRPSPYRLVRYDRRSIAQTICYVKGNESVIRTRTGESVSVTGREFRVRGVKYPVVVVESLDAAATR